MSGHDFVIMLVVGFLVLYLFYGRPSKKGDLFKN